MACFHLLRVGYDTEVICVYDMEAILLYCIVFLLLWYVTYTLIVTSYYAYV